MWAAWLWVKHPRAWLTRAADRSGGTSGSAGEKAQVGFNYTRHRLTCWSSGGVTAAVCERRLQGGTIHAPCVFKALEWVCTFDLLQGAPRCQRCVRHCVTLSLSNWEYVPGSAHNITMQTCINTRKRGMHEHTHAHLPAACCLLSFISWVYCDLQWCYWSWHIL